MISIHGVIPCQKIEFASPPEGNLQAAGVLFLVVLKINDYGMDLKFRTLKHHPSLHKIKESTQRKEVLLSKIT